MGRDGLLKVWRDMDILRRNRYLVGLLAIILLVLVLIVGRPVEGMSISGDGVLGRFTFRVTQ